MAAKICIAYPLFFSSDLQHRDQQVQARRLGVQPTFHQVRTGSPVHFPPGRYLRTGSPFHCPTRYVQGVRSSSHQVRTGCTVHFPPGMYRESSHIPPDTCRESSPLPTRYVQRVQSMLPSRYVPYRESILVLLSSPDLANLAGPSHRIEVPGVREIQYPVMIYWIYISKTGSSNFLYKSERV